MATLEQLQEQVGRMKEKIRVQLSQSADPSLDRKVRMTRKRLKRIQRRLRLVQTKKGRAESRAKKKSSKAS